MPGGGRGQERDQDRVDVVLEDAPGASPVGGPDVQVRSRRRWPVWVGLGVVLAVVVSSAVLTAGDERREREHRAALADVAGLLPHLGGPPEEVWTVSDARPVAVGRDVVVLERAEGDLVGVDLGTGEEVWRRPARADETCAPLRHRVVGIESVAATERLVCHRAFSTVEGYRVVVGDAASVEVIAVASGAVEAVLPTPADVLGVEPAGRDVVVASLDQQGGVEVSRWSLDGGAGWSAVWTSRPATSLEKLEATGWVLSVEADVVRVGAAGSVPLDLATGEPRPEASRPGVLVTASAPLPGGGRVEWDYDAQAAMTGVSRMVRPDGSAGPALDGVPWLPPVRDAVTSGVLVLRRPTSTLDVPAGDGDVVGVDPATGADVWSAGRLSGMTPLVELDGLLVAAGAGKVLAIDLRDGEVVWAEPHGGPGAWSGGLTDGDVVLVAGGAGASASAGAGAGRTLVARDLRSGIERWRVELTTGRPDDDLRLVPTAAGVLVVATAARGSVSLLAP